MEKHPQGSISAEDIKGWRTLFRAAGLPEKEVDEITTAAIDPHDVGGKIAKALRAAGATSAEDVHRVFGGRK